jgi:3-ketoacyl-CoA synthase
MSALDILAWNALDADAHMTRVTNADFRRLVEDVLAPKLSDEQVELYLKLLRSDRSRYIAADDVAENLDDDHGRRYARYRERTSTLARACVDDLLAGSGLDGGSIRAIVANTTVGGMVPNMTSQLANHLGARRGTRVMDLGYMGCAAALVGLDVVEGLLRPGDVGLVVSTELTSVMTNLLAETNESLVANTVFGDGVGAFLVARRPHSYGVALHLRGHAESVLTDDEAISAVTYEPNSVYHEIRLHDTIAKTAARGVAEVMRPLVRSHLSTAAERARYLVTKQVPRWQRHVDRAVLHTAGRRVIEGLTDALSLDERQAAHNLTAFDRYGNTSSASLYYSLEELRRREALVEGQRLLFLGYGSGFLTRGAVMRAGRG